MWSLKMFSFSLYYKFSHFPNQFKINPLVYGQYGTK
jgi:hypothetical protein